MKVRICISAIVGILPPLLFADCARAADVTVENGLTEGDVLDDPPIALNAGWSATIETPPSFTWTTLSDGFNREGPFTFVSDEPVVLCVTDDFAKGDVFRVFDHGVAIGETSFVPSEISPSAGPDAAAADPTYSTGAFLLSPGAHAITIRAIVDPFFGGRGYLRVDTLDHVPDACVELLDLPGLIATAGTDQIIECTSEDGAVVELSGAALDPEGDPLTFSWDAPESVLLKDPTSPTTPALFPIGVTEVTLTVSDGMGDLALDTVRITVVDSTPPDVVCTTDLAALYPPEHQMVEVGVFVDVTDTCTAPEDLILLAVLATSDEPDDATGNGDGNTTGDTDGADGYTAPVDITHTFVFNPVTSNFEGGVFLRAERNGNGSGRSYTIEAIVLDTHGNMATTGCVVVVPHDEAN